MTRNATIQFTTTYVLEECCSCGISFAVTSEFRERQLALKEKGQFFCPNGHAQHFTGKSLKDQLAAEERRRANAEEGERIAWAEAERLRKEAAAVKRRAKAALCPVPGCKRSFVQLARHIHTKHPEYAHGAES
jgi:hypothetical protein